MLPRVGVPPAPPRGGMLRLSLFFCLGLLFSLPSFAQGDRTAAIAEGIELTKEGDFPAARAAFSAAIGPADSLTALAWHKIGVTHYFEDSDSAAIRAYGRALAIRLALYPERHIDIAHTRSNIAKVQPYLGDFTGAADNLRAAIEIYSTTAPTDTLNWFRSLVNLTDVATSSNDLSLAINSARASLELAERTDVLSDYDRESAEYTAANTYQHFGFYDRALPPARSAVDRARAREDWGNLRQNLSQLAIIQTRRKEYRQAIQTATEAFDVPGDFDYAEDRGVLRLIIADAHLLWNDNFEPAFQQLRLARPDFTDAPRFIPQWEDLEARATLLSGDSLRARRLYEMTLRGFHHLDPAGPPHPDPDSLNTDQLLTAINLLRNRAETTSDPRAALKDYEHLFRLAETLRAGSVMGDSRRYLSAELRPDFDRAIDLYGELARRDPKNREAIWAGFLLSERAKAYTLLTKLSADRASRSERELELRERIAKLERDDRPAARRELAFATLQLDRILHQDSLPQRPVEFLTREGALEWLRSDPHDLLAYHVGKDQGHAWVLSERFAGQHLFYAPIAEVDSLATRVRNFREALLNSSYRGKSLRPAAEQEALDRRFLRLGKDLWWQLLDIPQPEDEATPPVARRLVIVPDGPLAALPFACIPAGGSSFPVNYSELEYLSTDFAITYAYSCAVLSALDKLSVPEAGGLAAFAPTFTGGPEGTARAVTGLRPLRYSAEEARQIASLFGGSQLYVGDRASRDKFVAVARDAGVLHLSTHGVADLTDPNRSFVAFTQSGDSLNPEEMLFFNDLAALDIGAEIVVLSACETALGPYAPGESTLSLASAFTAAGARSTITTLWSVDDAATKELMLAFYTALRAGATRAEALARAQEQTRNNRSYGHPYYWAGMTLYGADGTVAITAPESTEWPWWYYALGIVLLFKALGWYFVLRD